MKIIKSTLLMLCSPLILLGACLFVGLLILGKHWVGFMSAWSAGQDPAFPHHCEP